MLVVDTIKTIAPHAPHAAEAGAPSQTQIEATSGVDALIDHNQPHAKVWLEVLEERRRHGDLVCLEVSDDSREVLRLLLPFQDRVAALMDEGDEVLIALEMFQAIRRLNRSHPRFADFYGLLETARSQRATVIITDDLVTHEIVDVRLAAPEAEEGPGPKSDAAALVDAPAETAPPVMSLAYARQLFTAVSLQTCTAIEPESTCIPFLYPDEGCWVRAHQMWRVIARDFGVQMWKSWNYGGYSEKFRPLRAATRNHPNCYVDWIYHVAPVVTVSGLGPYVLDPSLFSQPVKEEQWTSVQKNEGKSVLVQSTGGIYLRTFGGEITYDPNYIATETNLRKFRGDLKLRSVGKDGPPPYRHCQL
jgi:hypothetical protein